MEALSPLHYPSPVVDAVYAAAVFLDTAASVVAAVAHVVVVVVICCFDFAAVFFLFVVAAVPVGDVYRIMKTSFSSNIFCIAVHIDAVVCAVLSPLVVPGVVV